MKKRTPPSPSEAVVSYRSGYGDLQPSDTVHEEVRQLGRVAQAVARQHLQRTPTTEDAILAAVRQFGPSPQSRKILNKENAAAVMAHRTGVYVVWRRKGTPRLRGANNDFCCRVGPVHRCFCGHPLKDHFATSGGGALPQKHRCGADGCQCPRFRYLPNEPEEIGEGWLTRRAGYNPSTWGPRCRCSHTAFNHDPLTQRCKECRCISFESHFLCVVCDGSAEDHETVMETEQERIRQGRPVGEAYFPLAGLDWSVREAVLKDPTGGGALLLEGKGKGTHTIQGAPVVDTVPAYCRNCATIFRSSESRFCSKCGAKR